MRRCRSRLREFEDRFYVPSHERRSWRRASRASAAAFAVALMVTLPGSADGEDNKAQPSSNGSDSNTGNPDDLSVDEALSEIPLNGTEESPITWRLPEGVGAEEQPAVLTARRFLAVDNLLGSLQDLEPLELFYRAVATDNALSMRLSSVHANDPNRGHGPVWIWLQPPQRLPDDELLISSCRDYGWVDVVGEQETLPRPRGQRSDVLDLVLRQSEVDGTIRWTVKRTHYPLLPDHGAAFDQACGNWAQHTP